MKNHHGYQEQIPAHLAGRLEGSELLALERHLGDCDECTSLEELGKDLVKGLREAGSELPSAHPAAKNLRLHARGAAGSEESAIVAHIASCLPCEVEVDAWGRLDKGESVITLKGRQGSSQQVQNRTWGWVGALAAGVLIGFAVALAFLPSFPLGPDESSTGSPWSGSVALLTLDNPSRGSQVIPTATLDPAQPYLPLAAAITLPAETKNDERFRFAIMRDEDELWTLGLGAEHIRAQQRATGVLTFLVPVERLAFGRLSFRALTVGPAGEEMFLEIPFELQRQSPAATNAPQ